jgi:hypothetical protein
MLHCQHFFREFYLSIFSEFAPNNAFQCLKDNQIINQLEMVWNFDSSKAAPLRFQSKKAKEALQLKKQSEILLARLLTHFAYPIANQCLHVRNANTKTKRLKATNTS